MHFIMCALDKSDAPPTRLTNREADKAFLVQAKIETLVSGPLVAEDVLFRRQTM